MSAKSAKQERLEDFARRCLELAAERSGRDDLEIQHGDVAVFFPCPMEGHQWKGSRPSAWASISGDKITAQCHRCTEKEGWPHHGDTAGYTAALAAEIGWSDDSDADSKRPDVKFIRDHLWLTLDGRFEVKTSKVKVGRRNPTWWYYVRPARRGALFEPWSKETEPNAWVQKVYRSTGGLSSILHVYRRADFESDGKLLDVYRVVHCEGAKDADSLRDLLATVPNCGIITTTLPSPILSSLEPHQSEVYRDRDVVVVPDADEGGDRFRKCWSGIFHGLARSVKLFPSREVFGEGHDLTDWVEAERAAGRSAAELATEWLRVATETAPQSEPEEVHGGWYKRLKRGEKGVSKTSLHNSRVVLVEHPDLAGKVWTNTRSGEIEVVDPPWAPGTVTVGARRVAASVVAWLEDAHDVGLSAPAMLAALDVDGAAPPRNPLAGLLEEEWDGVPRLDGLFAHYVPLDAPPGTLVRLARLFMGDLAAKLRGELRAQRVLVGVAARRGADVAWALLGAHGVQHRGRVEMRQVAQFARQEAALVQISAEPVVDRNMARGSVAHLFAADVTTPHGRISSPLFFAVGEIEVSVGTAAKSHVDERVLLVEAAGEPRLSALADDASQILAEAEARREELDETAMVERSDLRTVDDKLTDENLLTMLQVVHDYAVYDLDTPQKVAEWTERRAASRRSAPLEFIIRDRLLDAYGAHGGMLERKWRGRGEQEKIFNSACRRMRFYLVDGDPRSGVKITVTRAQAASIDLEIEKDSIIRPGVRLTEQRRTLLVDVLHAYGWENYCDFTDDFTDTTPYKQTILPDLPVGLEEEIPSLLTESFARARAHVSKVDSISRIDLKIPITARRSNAQWVVELGGVEVDAGELAEHVAREAVLDEVVLRSPIPEAVREWLADAGVDGVEVVDTEDEVAP